MLAVAAVVALMAAHSRSEAAPSNSGRSPAILTAHSAATKQFEYVVSRAGLYVYSIDHGNRLVQTISLPQIGTSTHGVVASPRTVKLYI